MIYQRFEKAFGFTWEMFLALTADYGHLEGWGEDSIDLLERTYNPRRVAAYAASIGGPFVATWQDRKSVV